MALTRVSASRCFGGTQSVYSHESRETGCVMRKLEISEPNTQSWTTNASPTRQTVGDPGQETAFNLVRRTAQLNVEGPIENVYQFMAHISELNRLMHAKLVKLGRTQQDETVTLEMNFESYDLVRKNSG